VGIPAALDSKQKYDVHQQHPLRPGRLHSLDLRVPGIAPVLLRQADHRNDLVLHRRPVADRLDYRPFPDPRHESAGRPPLSDWALELHCGWVLLTFLGIFGIHRFYMGKWITGIVYLLTGGLVGIGLLYDLWTLNGQVSEINRGELYGS
jgi:TM2 domain